MTSRWPRRAPFEHVTDTKTVFERVLFVPDTYRPGEPSRLRVKYDEEHGLTWLADERVTSESPTAQVVDGGLAGHDLTEDEVRWLHRQLGELVDRWDAKSAGERACKLCGKPYTPSGPVWSRCDECRALPEDKVQELVRQRKRRQEQERRG